MRNILLFGSLFVAIGAQKPIPVFIIDSDNATSHIAMPPPNPFRRLSAQSLTRIVQQVRALRGTIVVFTEYRFCVEYVTGRDELGSPYSYLHEALQQGKVKYIPAAVEPYQALRELLPPYPLNEFHLSYDGNTNRELFSREIQKSNYYYIYFKDRLNTTLTRSLREHDLMMYEVYFSMRNKAALPLVAFYTGIVNPISYRQSPRPITRQFRVQNTGGALIFYGSRSLIVMFGVYYKGVQTDPKEERVIAETDTGGASVTVSLSVQHNLKTNFIFHTTDKMYILDHIELVDDYNDTVMGIKKLRIKTQWTYSYMCASSPIRINSIMDGSIFTIKQFQLQLFRAAPTQPAPVAPPAGDAVRTPPPAVEGPRRDWQSQEDVTPPAGVADFANPPPASQSAKASLQFGPPVNCSKFISIPIFEGLGVALVFLGGILVGVNLLWGVQANSRYDDPRGARINFAEG